jgi:hypothetical protein
MLIDTEDEFLGHILKAYDMKHYISQIQLDCMILKAPEREMKPVLFTRVFYHIEKPVFSLLL